MVKSDSSQRWCKQNAKDIYVKMAREQGYRSRAVYKLQEIQQKHGLIKADMTVIDLGAAPGSWTVAANQWVGGKGKVIAVDILPMDGIKPVEFIQGDFTDNEIKGRIRALISGQQVDVVMSDIAPNTTGHKQTDQLKMMGINEEVICFANEVLGSNGSLILKVFQGVGFDDLLRVLKQHYSWVKSIKPKASKPTSREIYLVASNAISKNKKN